MSYKIRTCVNSFGDCHVTSYTKLMFVDETGFEPVRLRLQRNALPLELSVHLFVTNID